MSILIKSFGDNEECKNIIELKKVLIDKYQNKSVSIVIDKKTFFVDVSNDGELSSSYGSGTIDFNIN